MHRFYVAPQEAPQPGKLQSYQQGSSSTIQVAKECNIESPNLHIYQRKMQGSDDYIKTVSENPTVEYKH
jgi:hypothetical protein